MTLIKKIVFIVLLVSNFILFGQKPDKAFVAIINDTVPVSLNANWKYHQGDNKEFATYNFNDSLWDTIAIRLDLDKIPKGTFTGNCWFRLKVVIDSSLVQQPLGLTLSHSGASEIYIDGKLVHQFGKVGLSKADEQPFSPMEVIGIKLDHREYHSIAIRYSNHHYLENYKNYDKKEAGISVEINELNKTIAYETRLKSVVVFTMVLLFGILFTLSFVHFLLYIFYKKHKVNLYYSLFTFFFSLFFFCLALVMIIHAPSIQLFIQYYIFVLIPLLFFMLITFLYSLFYSPFPKIFWIAVMLTFLSLLFFFIKIGFNELVLTTQALFIIVEAVRVIIRAMIKKHKGANILGVGIFFFALFIVGIIIVAFSIGSNLNITVNGPFGILMVLLLFLALISIPISMSVYLAKDFATVNKDLESEKENLEIRVKDRTAEVVAQKELVEEKQKEITDSIKYAKRIQNAILPPNKLLKEYLPESFILYQPKDIVAGDFYWMEHREGNILFAAADCTGHGVPGAMVSVVCNNALNSSVREHGLTDPGEILNKTREIVVQEFEKSDEEVKDGMDIALCSLEFKVSSYELKYAGANNPLWIVRKGDLIEIKPNKQPIGKFDNPQPYTTHTFELQKGDSIYIFSDGYVDQFGGEKAKKFKAKAFKDLLLNIQNKTMEEQRLIISEVFETWKGNNDQVDDVCVIGVRI